jgi:hypothetical protein
MYKHIGNTSILSGTVYPIVDNTLHNQATHTIIKNTSYRVGSAGVTRLVAAPGIRCRRAVGGGTAGVGTAAGGPAGRLVAAVGRRPRRRHAGELTGSNCPRRHDGTSGDNWCVGLQAPPHPTAAMIHAAHHADACGSNPDADVKRVLGLLRHGSTGSSLNLRISGTKVSKVAQNTIFSACKQGKGVIYVQNMANPLKSFLPDYPMT